MIILKSQRELNIMRDAGRINAGQFSLGTKQVRVIRDRHG